MKKKKKKKKKKNVWRVRWLRFKPAHGRSSAGAENVDGKERRSNASNAMMIEKLNESRDEAIDLANKAEAALWAVEEGLLKSGNLGNKFSGTTKWSNEIKERRTNAKEAFGFSHDDKDLGGCLFVDILLRRLKEMSGDGDVAYPFKSVRTR